MAFSLELVGSGSFLSGAIGSSRLSCPSVADKSSIQCSRTSQKDGQGSSPVALATHRQLHREPTWGCTVATGIATVVFERVMVKWPS